MSIKQFYGQPIKNSLAVLWMVEKYWNILILSIEKMMPRKIPPFMILCQI